MAHHPPPNAPRPRTTRTPRVPRPTPDAAEELPRADEVRVLVAGLDPLAAAVALALADAGVCLLTVSDRSRVSARDVREGPYPAESEGLERELALRALLRRRGPRCIPLSAPELFPSAAVGSAVALDTWSVPGDMVTDLQPPPDPPADARLPTLTVVADGASVVRWPVTDRAHRPCRACVLDAVRRARCVVREHPLVGRARLHRAPLVPERDAPFGALTRTVVAGDLAGQLVCHSLGLDAPAQEPAGPLLHHGLHRIPLPPHPTCLCSLAFLHG